MKQRIAALISITVATACGSVSTAGATTLVRLSLEQMSQASTAIVRGRVVSQETRWNPQHTEILTYTTVAVENIVKGQPPPTVVIEQLGGTIGNLHEHVSATVHFRPNASYVLFLEPAGEDTARYLVVGMAQGAYRIYQDATTHEERVIRPFGGVFYGSGVKPTAGTTPLDHFQHELSTAMRTQVAIAKGAVLWVRIEATHSRGVGRLAVLGRTAADAYPSSTVVVPAGSEVEGTAERVAGAWKIRWTYVSIRGTRVAIAAASEEPARGPLGGKLVQATVR